MSDKPHICFISTTVYSYLSDESFQLAGGAERQQYLIANELKNKGYKISFITGIFKQTGVENLEGFDVYQSLPLESGVTGAPTKTWQLYKSMKRCDADIYYVRGNPFHCILVSHISKILRKKFVYSIANDAQVEKDRLKKDARFLYRMAYKKAIQSASEVATLTNHQRELLKKNYQVDGSTIPVGYDIPPLDNIPSTAERDYIFWAGRIVEYNDPMSFVKLAKEFPNEKFVMAGPAEIESDLDVTIMDEASYEERTLKTAREVSNLDYIGFVSPDKIHDYFKNAIAFIQTTNMTADIGNTTLEAWRYATPIITLYSTYDGRIESNKIGLYSESSFDKLVENTSRILSSPDLQRELGQNGRKHFEENYSLNKIVSDYESLFSSALK